MFPDLKDKTCLICHKGSTLSEIFFQNPIDKQAQSLFSNIVIPNSGINLDSCFFSRKTIIIQSLDKFRSGFMGNNAESSVATATGWIDKAAVVFVSVLVFAFVYASLVVTHS